MATRFQILTLVLLFAILHDAEAMFPLPPFVKRFLEKWKRSKITLDDLEGTWETEIKNADCAILVNGSVATACRANFPPDCADEIPAGHEKYIFKDGKLEQSYVHLCGIKTVEDAKKALPICAGYGIYPTEFKIGVDPSEIIEYDNSNGFLKYKNVRRTDTIDCVIAYYNWTDKKEPYLAFQQIVGFNGSLEEVMAKGPFVRCEDPPNECKVGFDDKGVLHLAFHNKFNLVRTSLRGSPKPNGCYSPERPKFVV